MKRSAADFIGINQSVLAMTVISLFGASIGFGNPPASQPAAASVAARPGWKLTWSDEFDEPNGSQPTAAKWNFELGSNGDGWGNSELEYYTHDLANCVIQNKQLHITATDKGASKYDAYYGPAKYTSARITTKSKFTQQYGRFEARIKIPAGRGMWPAFWMIGDTGPKVKWPECGEIDIMENVGDEPGVVHGTLHGPGPAKFADKGIGGLYKLPGGHALANDFHLYAVEWSPDAVHFYLDDVLYKTLTPKDLPSHAKWVWDHPFFLILNLAVGGDWPGPPDAKTKFPQSMIVDYVHVYSR